MKGWPRARGSPGHLAGIIVGCGVRIRLPFYGSTLAQKNFLASLRPHFLHPQDEGDRTYFINKLIHVMHLEQFT